MNPKTNAIYLTKKVNQKVREGSRKFDNILDQEIPKKCKSFMVAGGVSYWGMGKLMF